jgi:hypothetical protein
MFQRPKPKRQARNVLQRPVGKDDETCAVATATSREPLLGTVSERQPNTDMVIIVVTANTAYIRTDKRKREKKKKKKKNKKNRPHPRVLNNYCPCLSLPVR